MCDLEIYFMKRVPNILSKDTLFTSLLPWITEQQAFQKLLSNPLVPSLGWINECLSKALTHCCFSPKTIAKIIYTEFERSNRKCNNVSADPRASLRSKIYDIHFVVMSHSWLLSHPSFKAKHWHWDIQNGQSLLGMLSLYMNVLWKSTVNIFGSYCHDYLPGIYLIFKVSKPLSSHVLFETNTSCTLYTWSMQHDAMDNWAERS